MVQQKKVQRRNLNVYSWSILIAFILATIAMQYHTAPNSYESFFQTLPLIIIAVYYCEKLASLISQIEGTLKNTEIVARDSFILTFSFLLASLISLILAYNNSDAKGWWSLILYLSALYGLFFSVVFSVMALLIKNHKIYTMIFSLLIILVVSFGKCFPMYTTIPLLGRIETFFVITGLLFVCHCLVIIIYKIAKLFQCKKGSNLQR